MKKFSGYLSSLAGVFVLFVFPFIFYSFNNGIVSLSIVVEADTPTAFCSTTNIDCAGDVSINFSVNTDCVGGSVTLLGEVDLNNDGLIDSSVPIAGEYPNYSIAGRYEVGNHHFVIHASNTCGEETLVEIAFEVVDCEVSVPDCIVGLAVELLPVGSGDAQMEVWATDFIASGFSDCSGVAGYAVFESSGIESGEVTPTFPSPGIILNCESSQITFVRIYVWDNAYNPYSIQPDGSVGGANYGYCESYILILDSEDVCGGVVDPRIAGRIFTEDEEPVPGVSVTITGDLDYNLLTNASGEYATPFIPVGSSETVTPTYDVDPLNGVTILDVILLSKHLLGIKLLDSPYKMIAADVNNSGTLTVLDIIYMRKLMLGLISEFPNNSSWRFVAADYYFPNGSFLDADFPEAVLYDSLGQGDLEQHNDFIAIKIGDLNGSAVVSEEE